jgi:hypothetical protein
MGIFSKWLLDKGCSYLLLYLLKADSKPVVVEFREVISKLGSIDLGLDREPQNSKQCMNVV